MKQSETLIHIIKLIYPWRRRTKSIFRILYAVCVSNITPFLSCSRIFIIWVFFWCCYCCHCCYFCCCCYCCWIPHSIIFVRQICWLVAMQSKNNTYWCYFVYVIRIEMCVEEKWHRQINSPYFRKRVKRFLYVRYKYTTIFT